MSTHLYCVLPQDERAATAGRPERRRRRRGARACRRRRRRVGERRANATSRCRSTACARTTRSSRRRSRPGSTPVPARFGQRFADDARVPRRSVESGGVGRVAAGDGAGLRRDDAHPHAVDAADDARSRAGAARDVRASTRRAPDAAISRRSARAKTRPARFARRWTSSRRDSMRPTQDSFVRVRRPRSGRRRMPLRTISHLDRARRRFDQYRRAVRAVQPTANSASSHRSARAYSFCALTGGRSGRTA